METHGLESAIPAGFSDVRLPQNSDDKVWDTSDSSTVQPKVQSGFTDLTFALMQYESAALLRIVLTHSVPMTGEERAYSEFHSRLRQETWNQLERTYLTGLDPLNLRQSLTLDIAKLTFKRIHLTQLRPLMRSSISNPTTLKELEHKYIYLQQIASKFHTDAFKPKTCPTRP